MTPLPLRVVSSMTRTTGFRQCWLMGPRYRRDPVIVNSGERCCRFSRWKMSGSVPGGYPGWRSNCLLFIQLPVARKQVAVVLGITKPERLVEVGIPLTSFQQPFGLKPLEVG
jgi:hypothetical protein